MRVFSSRKERQKKSDREKEKKKKLREKVPLSLPNNTRCPPKRTFVCFASSSSPPISMCSGGTLSLRARILLSIIHSLSIIMCMYSAALFFRFLKLRNKIRTLSLYSRNSKKRRRRRRRVYFLFPSLSQTLASRARLKINVFSLSLCFS